MKGLVNVAEEPGRPAVIQGAQHLLHTMTWLDRWPDWPAPGLALSGPAGCGKTHLAHVFRARTGARLIQPAELSQDPLAILAEGNGEAFYSQIQNSRFTALELPPSAAGGLDGLLSGANAQWQAVNAAEAVAFAAPAVSRILAT